VGAVHARYFTDPASASCWSVEPHLRRLELELGDQLEVQHVMAGIRELAPSAETAREWLEASAASGMPVDVRLWLEGGPTTSYPACLAVKAAAEQGNPRRFLRALREGFAFRRRRLDHAEAFESVARELGGLDLDRLRIDMGSHAIVEAFGADLDRARAVDEEHWSAVHERVALPALELRGDDGEVHGVYGLAGYEAYRDAAVAAGAELRGGPAPTVEEALRRFGTMATVEVAAVCDLPGPRAAAELWRAAADWRVRAEPTVGGEIWSLA
jgi:predicted DsbA family dithiol-disulfide isomerase